MKVLVLGGGGREHSLCWKIKKSPLLTKLFAIPGNGGISEIAECIDISLENFQKIGNVIKENNIELTIVGPEKPLAEGFVEFCKENTIKTKIFGPNKKCAILESSKAYTKDMCAKKGIPHPKYNVFTDYTKALKYISSLNSPAVIKADGLAGGKGTFVCTTLGEAKKVLEDLFIHKKLSKAGEKIVVEEFLEGKEISYMVITDNDSVLTLPPARDFKRLLENNQGPNTGGMGTIAPLTDFTEKDEIYATEKIILPALSAVKSQKETYIGVLYAGLMKTNFDIKLLEFNVRFGDPETQCILPLIKNDLLEIILYCTEGKLKEAEIQLYKKYSCCVCLVSGGYPEKFTTGYEIFGLDEINNSENIVIFHAGTKKENNRFYTNGGRVLNVVGLGNTPQEAHVNAYSTISKIKFENMFFRKDIKW